MYILSRNTKPQIKPQSFGQFLVFFHLTGELKTAHQLCCKGLAVDSYGVTLCAALLHHFELVQYAELRAVKPRREAPVDASLKH
jgi:hypothetical protein